MQHPDKWRETIDPQMISFQRFRLGRILGYPHAGNDVFHIEGEWDGAPCRAFLKVARQIGANVANEAAILSLPGLLHMPELLEWSPGPPAWLLTREARGERLSTILGENRGMESLRYMEPYGRALARLHALPFDCAPVAHRRFFDAPAPECLNAFGLACVGEWLEAHGPVGASRCFVHGDFHYANLLWHGGALSCILDWELSGLGVREFDMAWAVFLRPGQRFLKTADERERFLSGYASLQPFSRAAFNHYLVQIAAHFYAMGDEAYRGDVRALLDTIHPGLGGFGS